MLKNLTSSKRGQEQPTNGKDAILSEIRRCKSDPAYFARNYVFIKDKQKGAIKFKLWEFQEKALRDFQNNRLNIVLKARQLGMTELMAMYVLWFAMFQRDKTVVIVSKHRKAASDLVKRVKYAYKKLPQWLKVTKLVSDNVHTVEFDNDSVIFADSSSENAGRGIACSLFIVDEAAFIPTLEEMWAAVFPSIDSGGSCIVSSCVTEDTFITTDKGIKQLSEFIDKKVPDKSFYKINKYNIVGKDKLYSGNLLYNNGKVPTKKITTKFAELEGSFNHKLWAYKSDKNEYNWFRLDELTTDDFVSIQYGRNIWGNNDDVSDFTPTFKKAKHVNFKPELLTPDLCYFIGLYLSEGNIYIKRNQDGSLKRGQMSLTCGDFIGDAISNCGLKYYLHKDKIHYNVSSISLLQFFEYLKFEFLKAPNKYIPSRLLECSKENIAAMLSGIFDGDGSSHGTRGTISIALSSEKMINQIRAILLNFGILCYKSVCKVAPTARCKVWSTVYRLELNSEMSERFYDLIGFRFERKQKNKNKLKIKTKNEYSYFPSSKKIFNEFLKISNTTESKLRRKYGIRSSCKSITDKNFSKILEHFKNNLTNETEEILKKSYSDNIIWVKIKDIINGENYTYDFSLPEAEGDPWCHSVLYNGLIGHQTPNGSAGQFYNLYQEAPKNGFNPIKLDWDSRPDRDQEWYEKTRLSMSPKKFSQEFLCSFLLSGDTVIDGEDIERHEQNVKKFGSNRKEIGPAKDVWVWKEYNHMHRYCLGADVARGDGEDYSAFTILDFDTGEIVCEYKGKIKVDRFAELLITCANNYGQCLIIVENNSYGLAVLMKLIDLKYPSIYWEEKGTKQYRDGYVDFNNDDDAVPGFTTTQRSRFAIVDNLEESFRTNRITTYSQRMISEMRNFIYENGKPKARKGSNDDLIMALSITLFIASMIFSSREEDYEMKRRLLDNFRLLENQASIKVPGEIGYNKDKNLLQVDENDPYKYKFRNETIDFRMLIGNSESKKKEEPIVNQGIIFLGYIK